MPRRFDGDRLVIASHNPGKVREIGDLLAPFHVEVASAGAPGAEVAGDAGPVRAGYSPK